MSPPNNTWQLTQQGAPHSYASAKHSKLPTSLNFAPLLHPTVERGACTHASSETPENVHASPSPCACTSIIPYTRGLLRRQSRTKPLNKRHHSTPVLNRVKRIETPAHRTSCIPHTARCQRDPSVPHAPSNLAQRQHMLGHTANASQSVNGQFSLAQYPCSAQHSIATCTPCMQQDNETTLCTPGRPPLD